MSEVKAYRGLAREMGRERKAIWFEPLEVHWTERRMQSPEPAEDDEADVDRALEGGVVALGTALPV